MSLSPAEIVAKNQLPKHLLDELQQMYYIRFIERVNTLHTTERNGRKASIST